MKDSYQDHRLSMNNPRNFFQGEPIISDQISREGLEVIWRELEKVLQAGLPGDIVEFGCYVGTTSLFIRRLLNQHEAGRTFHAYDSFEGLPEKGKQDENAAGVDFEAGKLSVGKKELLHAFKRARLDPPTIHKGWFDQLTPADVPDGIAFAFLDGDFYGSILCSLKLVYPRMRKGGIILIDDYRRETLPGVERAVRDFFQGEPPSLYAQANIAVIRIR